METTNAADETLAFYEERFWTWRGVSRRRFWLTATDVRWESKGAGHESSGVLALGTLEPEPTRVRSRSAEFGAYAQGFGLLLVVDVLMIWGSKRGDYLDLEEP